MIIQLVSVVAILPLSLALPFLLELHVYFKRLNCPFVFFTAFFASAGEYDDAEWFGNGEQPNISLVRSADAIWSDDKQYEGDLITGGLNEMPETGWLTSGDHLPVKVNLKLTGQIKEGVVNALLSVRLDDDWKIYWRAPGEGGVAPKLEWESASVNVKDVNWFWPTPSRYPVLGVDTIGYKGAVDFPIQIDLKKPTEVTQLRGNLSLASCTHICVMNDYKMTLNFYPGELMINEDLAFSYAQALSSVPVAIDKSDIESHHKNANIEKVASSWDQLKQEVTVQLTHEINWNNPDLLLNSNDPALDNVFFSKPDITVDNELVTATFKVSSWGGEVNLSGALVHVTAVLANDFAGPRVGVGYVHSDSEIVDESVDANGFKGEIGYDFNQIVGLNLSYSATDGDVEGFDVDKSSIRFGVDTGYAFPVQNGYIKPYLLAGVQKLDIDVEGVELSDETGLYAGIGTRFTYKNVYTDISYTISRVDTVVDEDLDYTEAAIAIGYKF